MKKKKKIKKQIRQQAEVPDCLSDHVGCYGIVRCWGQVQAIYVFKRRPTGQSRFLKIGEYCCGCGQVYVLRRFQKGIDYRLKRALEAEAEYKARTL